MLPAALLACSIGVAAPTVEAVIAVESGGRAGITHLNRNGTVDYGLMQINGSNLPAFGLTPQQAMDPCTNIRVGTTILQTNYAAAALRYGEGQYALQVALSAYNTGSFERGFLNGYVAKYYSGTVRHSVIGSIPIVPIATVPLPLSPYMADPQILWKVDNLDPY